MKTQIEFSHKPYKQEIYYNLIAAVLSIVPGLGHIYKGHIREGIGILIISPFFIWAGLIFGFATVGIGLLVPFIYIIGVGWHAWQIDNHRKHFGIF